MFFKTQKKQKLYYFINTSSIFDKAYFLLFLFFNWKTSFYISFHSKGKSLEFKIEFDFVVGLYF